MPVSCCFSSVSRPVLHSTAASAFLKQLRRRAHQKLFMSLTLQAELRVACGTLHQSWIDTSLLPFDYLIYSAFPKFPQELPSPSEWLILWHVSWIKVGLQLTSAGYQTSLLFWYQPNCLHSIECEIAKYQKLALNVQTNSWFKWTAFIYCLSSLRACVHIAIFSDFY